MNLDRLDDSLNELRRLAESGDENLRGLERAVKASPSDGAAWDAYLRALGRVGQKPSADVMGLSDAAWEAYQAALARVKAEMPPELFKALAAAARTKGAPKRRRLKQLAHDERKKQKTATLAQIEGDNYVLIHPNHISGGSHDGRAWLIGLPFGNWATYRVIFGRHESDAYEAAREEWPHDFEDEQEGSIHATKVVRGVQTEPHGRDYELADGTIVHRVD